MKHTRYIVDADAKVSSYHSVESYTYRDSNGIERVAYTSGTGSEDMTLRAYLAHKQSVNPAVILKVIDSKEYEARMDLYRQERMKEESEITQEEYDWLFECLPPCRWNVVSGVDMFHMSERLCFDLVHWVAQIGDKYYKLVDSDKAELTVIAKRFINLNHTLNTSI